MKLDFKKHKQLELHDTAWAIRIKLMNTFFDNMPDGIQMIWTTLSRIAPRDLRNNLIDYIIDM